MEVHLTPDQESFARRAVAAGRFQSEEEAVLEALSLWEERERARAEILAGLAEAEADLDAGRYVDYTDETPPRLAAELKREAREPGVQIARVVHGRRNLDMLLGR